jgi:phosphoenolpyruvate synthase/pyruvate phosphate dikinase
MNAMHILWLDEPAWRDAALVGGKVDNLSLLACAYPVPEGFCLTVTTFKRFSQGHMPPDFDEALRQSYQAPATHSQRLDRVYRALDARSVGWLYPGWSWNRPC